MSPSVFLQDVSVRVRIPAALRAYAAGEGSVEVEAATVGEAISALVAKHATLRPHLFEDAGKLRGFVTLYLNQKDVRNLQGDATPLAPGDVLLILPSVAGGSGRSTPLSREELPHYSRHLIMPEVGLKGQERLKGARVLLVGAGGLGSPSALYLAAAGVGRIGLVDADDVDRTNLHRQVLYGAKDVGRPKLKAARERLEDLNPHIAVDVHETRFRADNAQDLLRDYDILVDGTDNFPTRYLANDVAALQGKPNVHGSIFRFDGQVSVFDATRGPCYRCIYRTPPPPGLVPSCAEGGVLGVLPGVVGTLQAVETVKLIVGIGEPLVGKLLLFDALSMEFTTLELRKDPSCPLCGTSPTITGLVDYEDFCGLNSVVHDTDELAPKDLDAALRSGEPPFVLDVREPWEAEIASIPSSVLVPLKQLVGRAAEVPLDRDVVVFCHHGARSAEAVRFLRGLGHRRVRNLAGGVDAWADEVNPALARY